MLWLVLECAIIIATYGVCFLQYPPNFSNPTGKVAYITNAFTQEAYRKQGKTLYQKLGFMDAEGFMMKQM